VTLLLFVTRRQLSLSLSSLLFPTLPYTHISSRKLGSTFSPSPMFVDAALSPEPDAAANSQSFGVSIWPRKNTNRSRRRAKVGKVEQGPSRAEAVHPLKDTLMSSYVGKKSRHFIKTL